LTPAGEVFLDWIQLPAMKSNGVKFESRSTPQIGPRRIFANLAPVKGKKGRDVILSNPKGIALLKSE
jgi:hypothetical protein